MDLRSKAAVITGSATGVGRAAALAFARRGCHVAVNYNHSRSEAEAAAELCRLQGVNALAIQADVSIEADCVRLIQAAAEGLGRLDILVNNAAVTRFVEFGNLEGLTEDAWLEILRTNVMGNFFCSRAAVPHMKQAGAGAIINVVSIAGFLGHGSSIAYSASKAAVINMTKCLARTLGPEIRVNGIAPGAIDTRWLRRGLGESRFQELGESMKRTTPLERMAMPEDVAEAIVWLAEGAAMMTGETIKFDGGQHLGGKSGLHRNTAAAE